MFRFFLVLVNVTLVFIYKEEYNKYSYFLSAMILYRQMGDRKSVVEGKGVDLGGRRISKKKKRKSTPIIEIYYQEQDKTYLDS